MDNKVDKTKIHINPDFIYKRAEHHGKPRVHVNPAFFQKSGAPHEGTLQPIHSCHLPGRVDNQILNGSKVQQLSSASIMSQYQASKIQNSNPATVAVQSNFECLAGGIPKRSASFVNNMPSAMNNQSRLHSAVSPISRICSESGRGALHSQVSYASAKVPSTYSLKTSNHGLSDYSSVVTSVSNFSRNTQWSSSVVTSVSNSSRNTQWSSNPKFSNASKFKYQSQDVNRNKHSSSNSCGSKFKIDNRAYALKIDRNTKDTMSGSVKACDMERSLLKTNTAFTSNKTSSNQFRNLVDVKLVEFKSTNCMNKISVDSAVNNNVSGDSVCKSQSSVVLSNSNATVKRLNLVSESRNTSVIDNEGSKKSSNLGGECSSIVAGKADSLLSTTKYGTTDLPDKNVVATSHVKKNSSIHISPVLLKSLSSNDKIDIVAIASKSCEKNESSVEAKNSKLMTQKSKVSNEHVKLTSKYKLVKHKSGSPSLASRYKLLSKTKLVRRRSNSFSKGKTTPPVTLCRPSPVFPSRLHHSLRVHPRRRSVIISRTKLIRRLSGSGNAYAKNEHEKQNYSIKTKTKLVKQLSSSSPRYPMVTGRLKLCNIGADLESKKKYAVLSKTKLIRRKSSSGTLKTKEQKGVRGTGSGTIIRRHKLVRNAHLQPARVHLAKSSKFNVRQFRKVNTKYKIENKSIGLSAKQKAARGIVSKYRINRLKGELPNTKQTSSRSFTWTSSKRKIQHTLGVRSGSEKFSDRFVNIGGILYKATKTSLCKQTAKEKHIQDGGKGSKCVLKLHGHQYHVSAGGLSLTRVVKKAVTSSGPFLSRVHIGGLTYSRTKTGHYELTKVHQARAVLSSAKQRSMQTLSQKKKRGLLQKCNQHCIFFNRFGRCTRKDKGECPYLHNPKRIAICTRFLRGRCPVKNCQFSHEIDPAKMPVCSHFLRSTCTRESCPYRHVRVNPNAPLCLDFLQGHCPLGEECRKQHVLECEEFSTSGKCPRGGGCLLSHRKGSRKKRKSITLEPVMYSTPQKGVLGSPPKRQKSSNGSFDGLGGPVIKKKEKKAFYKPVDSLHRRYFQVSSENDCVAEDDASSTSGRLEKDSSQFSGEGELNSISNVGLDYSSEVEKGIVEEKEMRTKNSTVDSDVEQRREAVLQTVEKIKDTFDATLKSAATENEIHQSRDKVKSDEDHEISMNKVIHDSPVFKCDAYERRPLPKRLPSYISLTKDIGDVDDL